MIDREDGGCRDLPNAGIVIRQNRRHQLMCSYFTVNRTWSYFSSYPGINMTGLHLREVIISWWEAEVKKDMRPYYRATPSFIIWELWRRRNKKQHEDGNISVARVIHNVTRNMHMLIQVRKPQMSCPIT